MERYDPDQVPTGQRSALLGRVPRQATVLDVGCWSGFTGRHLISTREATVDGVEPDAGMAERAQDAYRQVIPEPIERALDTLLRRHAGAYDAVLLLDVLEHLVDPAAVLRTIMPLLAPGGRLLVSLPNVAHWTVRKDLLLGRWRYARSGLLDETHLRFFTLESGERLLTETGYTIRWREVSLDQPPLVHLPARLLGELRRWPTLFAVQMLFEAVPTGQTR